jgi:hypothetical protein
VSEVEPICERRFTAIVDGEETPATVRWMKPHPDGNDWRCEWTLTLGAGAPRHKYAMGVDSTQALVLAFAYALAVLATYEHRVFWFEPDDDLGLPGGGAVHDELRAERAARRRLGS